MKSHHSVLGIFIAAIWGFNFVMIKVACPHFSPFTFATVRFGLACLPFVFLLPRPKTPWKKIMGFSAFMWVGQFIPMFMAIELGMPAGLCSVLTQAQVMVTTILSIMILKARLSPYSGFGLALSSLGLFWIACQDDQMIPSLSYLLLFISILSISIGNLLIKTDEDENMISFICWSAFFAFIPMLGCALYFEGPAQFYIQINTMPAKIWAAVLYTSYGSTLIGFSLWGYLMRLYTPTMVASFALLVPIFGIAFSTLMLGEKFTPLNYAASALIILGLTIHQMYKPLILYLKDRLQKRLRPL